MPPVPSPAPQGTRTDWVVDKILSGLIGSALRLPYRARVPYMGAAVAKGIGPLAGYRQRAEQNLLKIWPDMGVLDRRALATAVCDNFGRTLIENFSWTEFATHLSDTLPTGPGLDALAAAHGEGRPVIFVTGHFGNHEAPRQVLTRLGYEVGGLYRPMANPYFDAHYAQTMTAWGGPVFAQGRRGTIGFARHIAHGGMGTLLFDVHQAAGQPIDFLGQPAMTVTSAADLALKYDALLIPYFGIRQPDGLSFAVELDAPIPHGDPLAMMTEATRRLEARIHANPAQWFWVHRRWKPAKT